MIRFEKSIIDFYVISFIYELWSTETTKRF
nr:MAG TPA: hypothetical protein [Caudoviricetes sp.]